MHEWTGASTEVHDRRKFLRDAGERALWVAPTVATLLTAAATPARADGGYEQRNYSPQNLWELLFRRRMD